jgi:hypothetical protein
MNAFRDQVGGDHYTAMPIQPIEFSMRNGYDACIHSAIKYVSRHRAKGGLEDINKAQHSIRLRHELLCRGHTGWTAPRQEIPPEVYAAENNLGIMESVIVFLIHVWASKSNEDDPQALLADMIEDMLKKLAIDTYCTPREKADA